MSPPKSLDPAEPPIAVLLGLPFHDLTMEEALDECRFALDSTQQVYFVTANVDFAAQAYENENLRKILFFAKRVVCDGMPLIWISKVLGHPLRERVAGSDLTPRLLQICSEKKKRVYFFGSDEKTLGEVVQILSDKMPELTIAGYESPPMGKIQDWDNDGVIQRIRDAKTDLLLVALGCPKQEDWIYLFHQRTGASLSIGIGASLDFVSGKQVRAPIWMQRTGMEWLWRMGTNPKRLLGRYARDFLFLGWVTLKQLLTQRRRTVEQVSTGQSIESEPANFLKLVWSGSVERATLETLAMPENWEKPVLLDLSGIDFMDSAGMGALAGMARNAREAKQALGLLKPSDTVMRTLKAVRLDSLFKFLDDEQAFSAWLTESEMSQTGADTIRFQLDKWYDKSNAHLLTSKLQTLIKANPQVKRLLLDCSQVTFIDSSGITSLLVVRRQLLERGGAVELVDPSPPVRRVVSLLCMESFLPEHHERKAGH
ncbi:WecB/TagA/CpsF family glycosyltransferase [Cerasicoccus maritimus]|uniref:WecB/TagA/CpsF family glycosyltransferase n=1 Tax=Cerasicoccus maritimus TaxID=490089 RepID=UPI002852AFE4|nr:WecB/TagA/CpsF family glycosyltransferase [Cerasicoccus maritimus]